MGSPVKELSDAEVFGTAAPAGELSDAEVFGAPAAKPEPGLWDRAKIMARDAFEQSGTGTVRRRQESGQAALDRASEMDLALGEASRAGSQVIPNETAPGRVSPFAGLPVTQIQTARDKSLVEGGQKQSAWMPAERARRAEVDALPSFADDPTLTGKALKGATNIGAMLVGGAPSPENLVPVGRGATLARTFLKGAAVNAGAGVPVDVMAQKQDVQLGLQEAYDPVRTAINAGLGAAIGGTVNAAPQAAGMVRDAVRARAAPSPGEMVAPPRVEPSMGFRVELSDAEVGLAPARVEPVLRENAAPPVRSAAPDAELLATGRAEPAVNDTPKTAPGFNNTQEPLRAEAVTGKGLPIVMEREFRGKYNITGANGEPVGSIAYAPNADGGYKIAGVDVRPEFRRQGVATSAYDFLEKNVIGAPFEQRGGQSADGAAFRAARNASAQPAPVDRAPSQVPPERAVAEPIYVDPRHASIGPGHPDYQIVQRHIDEALASGNHETIQTKRGPIRLVHLQDDDAGNIVAFDANRKRVGSLIYNTVEEDDGMRWNPSVHVDDSWHRQGIATAMYDAAERAGGKIPELSQRGQARSVEGQAFREARARKQSGSMPAPTSKPLEHITVSGPHATTIKALESARATIQQHIDSLQGVAPHDATHQEIGSAAKPADSGAGNTQREGSIVGSQGTEAPIHNEGSGGSGGRQEGAPNAVAERAAPDNAGRGSQAGSEAQKEGAAVSEKVGGTHDRPGESDAKSTDGSPQSEAAPGARTDGVPASGGLPLGGRGSEPHGQSAEPGRAASTERGWTADAEAIDRIGDTLHGGGPSTAQIRAGIGAGKKGVKNVVELARGFARTLFYKPVQNIRDLETPTARKLADIIFADENTRGEAVAPDYFQKSSAKRGEFNTRLADALAPLKGRLGLSREKDMALIADLRAGTNKSGAAVEVRKLLDDVQAYANSKGLDVGHVENYFPRVYDLDRLSRKAAGFKQLLTAKGFTDDQATSVLRHITESGGIPDIDPTAAEVAQWRRRAGGAEGRASQNPNLEKGRKLKLTDDELSQWLVNDTQAVLTRYFRKVAERAEYADIFGPKEGKLNDMVREIIAEARQNGTKTTIKQITDDIYGLADAMQGKHNPIQNDKIRYVNGKVSNAQIVMKLGLVSLASIPETFAPISHYGLFPKAYAKGVLSALAEATGTLDKFITGTRHVPKVESRDALERLGAIAMTALESAQAERFGGVQRAFTTKFMHATGLEALTNMQRVIAFESAKSVMVRNARFLAAQPANTATMTHSSTKRTQYEMQLKQMGLDVDEAKQWVTAGMPLNGPFADKMNMAGLRAQNWTITTPNPATKSLWMSDPHWAQVSLFKTFTDVFSNTFLKKGLKDLFGETTLQRKGEVLGGLVAATATAYAMQALRESIAGSYEDKKNPKTEVRKWLDALDRSGYTGDLTYLYALTNPYKFGYTDKTSQRLFNLAGPTIGDAAKITDAVASGDTYKMGQQAARMTPVLNINKGVREATGEAYQKGLENAGMAPGKEPSGKKTERSTGRSSGR